MARYEAPDWRQETDYDVSRVGSTMHCDSDEIPPVAITREQYMAVGGAPLQRGKRVAEAEFVEQLHRDNEARTTKRVLQAIEAVLAKRKL